MDNAIAASIQTDGQLLKFSMRMENGVAKSLAVARYAYVFCYTSSKKYAAQVALVTHICQKAIFKHALG